MNQPLNTIPSSIAPYTPSVTPIQIDTPHIQNEKKKRQIAERALEKKPVIIYDLPSSPVLTKPGNVQKRKKERVEALLLRVHKRCEDINKENTIIDKDDIDLSTNRISGLHKEYLEEIKKQGMEQEASDSWRGIQHVAQYLTAFSSMALGAFMLSQGQAIAAGRLMIFAAGLGLFTQAMKDSGGFNKMASYFSSVEKTQKKIASTLEVSFMVLSMGIGLYQVVTTFPSGVQILAQLPQDERLGFLKNAFAAAGLATSVLTQGMQHYHRSKQNFHAETAKRHEATKSYVENTMGRLITNVESNIRNQTAYMEVIKRMLNNIPVITR